MQKHKKGKFFSKNPSKKQKSSGNLTEGDQQVFGIHAVKATLEHMPGRAIKLHVAANSQRTGELIALATQMAVVVESHTKEAFVARFGEDVVHQGAVLSTKPFPYVDLQSVLDQRPQLCVILDGIEDPRNLGRAARSAFALGAQLLIISHDRAAQITGVAEKAAVGTLAKLPVARVVNLSRAIEDLKNAGLWIIGAAGDAPMRTWECDLTKPVALVIGSEEKGIRPLVQKACDELVSIPMAMPDLSLNAADALTILMYEAARQRQDSGKKY